MVCAHVKCWSYKLLSTVGVRDHGLSYGLKFSDKPNFRVRVCVYLEWSRARVSVKNWCKRVRVLM